MTHTLPPVVAAGAAPDQLGTVSNGDTAIARDYVDAVFRRGREPMEPLDFEIDWDDQPSRHKTYRDVVRLPLPPLPASIGPATVLLDRTPHPPGHSHPSGRPAGQETSTRMRVAGAGWDLAGLGALLRLSYGVLDRRLQVNWNQDADKRAHYPATTWGRGTASGGGMYPLEAYLVSGPSGPLLPGVYHYATAHHELERLGTGDVTDRVSAAVASDAAPAADSYLLVSVRFWKNSFKYNSFCYHVVTQDLGALAGSWDVLARAMGRRADRVLWFDERCLDAVLGLDSATESVLAAVPLTWATDTPAARPSAPTPAAPTPAPPAPTPTSTPPRDTPAYRGSVMPSDRAAPAYRGVGRVAFERSARLLRFPLVDRVHAAALVGDAPRPAPDTWVGAAPGPVTAASTPGSAAAEPGAPPVGSGHAVDLPPPLADRLRADLGTVVRSRRSSFGGFTSAPPLPLDELGTLLAAGATAGAAGTDIKPDGARLTRLFVLANRVDGLPPGGYAHDPDGHRLLRVLDETEQPMGELLQRHYLLTNYNTEQAAAVIVITGRVEPMLAGYGNRGYRMLNSEVGAVAQAGYLAAAALGVGCGAVLGLDNIAIDALLGIGTVPPPPDETAPLLAEGRLQSGRPTERRLQSTAAGSMGAGDERSMLFLLVGPERSDPADLDMRLG